MPKTCFIIQSFKTLFKNEFPDLLSWQYNLINLIFFHLSSAYIMSIAFDIYIYMYTLQQTDLCQPLPKIHMFRNKKSPVVVDFFIACSSGSSNSCKAEGSQGKSPNYWLGYVIIPWRVVSFWIPVTFQG